MQKFTLTVNVNDLIEAKAVFRYAPARGEHAVDVTLRAPDGQILTFEFKRASPDEALIFVTTDEDVMDAWTGDLSACGVLHHLSIEHGRVLRVNVLEILKAGFLVHAPANRNVLRVRLPQEMFYGVEIEMNFRNDGTNLWAEFFANPEQEKCSGELAVLESAFTEARVTYEVL